MRTDKIACSVLLSALGLVAPSAARVVPAVPAPAISSSSSEAETCFGQIPTIVGSPDGGFIEGTEGPDVAVTNGADGVDLLGGDDLLCITGVPVFVNPEFPPSYATGTGSDRINSSLGTAPFIIKPGAGPDEVIGGDADEFVSADDSSTADSDADVIATAGGRDQVYSGSDDVVALGSGPDFLGVTPRASGGAFEGGTGRDNMSMTFGHLGEHSWKIDSPAGRMTRNGHQLAEFSGFAGFEVRAVRGLLRFIGSDNDETFNMNRSSHDGLAVLRMNGGDDYVSFLGGKRMDARIDGGAGNDKFSYSSSNDYRTGPQQTSIQFNMTTGLLRDTWPEGETTRRAVNFERAVVSNESRANPGATTIKGTSGANWLKAWGPGPTTIFGRAGDDEMIGGSDGTVLIGGPGQDMARGGTGIDRCEAEVRLRCEL